jgi:hypothetical protein
MVRRVGGSSPQEGFAVAVVAVDHRDARAHEAANRSRARSSASASWTAKRTRRCCSRVKLARAPRRRFPRLGQGANGRPHVTSRVSAQNACHVSGLRAATVSRSGCGVINVDQSLQVAPFANLVRSLADKAPRPELPRLVGALCPRHADRATTRKRTGPRTLDQPTTTGTRRRLLAGTPRQTHRRARRSRSSRPHNGARCRPAISRRRR